jgi:hypothetical protein
MGSWVHFHVCFHCHRYNKAAVLANKYLPTVPDEYIYKEAKEFLIELSSRSGDAPGHKSGLYVWGFIGNYTLADEFVDILIPFWTELLTDDESEDGPSSEQRVLVFWQMEDWEHAHAFEIGWEDPWAECKKLAIKHHENLPFSWWAQ